MPTTPVSRSAAIHDTLGHPVIDCDGHSIDFMPLLEDYLREFGGAKAVDRYRSIDRWFGADDETRRRLRLARPSWWGYPTENTADQMTTMLPALLEERLGEMGLDFSIIYPSPLRVGVPHLADDDLRQPLCRALNTYQADLFAPHAARLTPAAVIPMHTPTEALEELEYAVKTLHLKATQLASYVQRPLNEDPGSGRRARSSWWDNLALDSEYDYDVVWAKCQELKVVPGFHSGTMGLASRTSYSNNVYNHIGHFASGCEPICKALFLGGVTKRFPSLRFIFLESGVGWATALFCDLLGHWKKRNTSAIARFDPARVDYAAARTLFERYADERMLAKIDRIEEIDDRLGWLAKKDFPDYFDEFAAVGISEAADVRDRFVPNFFFGCEGDDVLNRLAFDTQIQPFGAMLHAVFGSDIGHWDVPNMKEVLEESYELVEDGHITPAQFRSFVFSNPVALHARTNPGFFAGTVVEDAVNMELASQGASK